MRDKATRYRPRRFDAAAERLFTELNQRHFRGRLPVCRIVRARRKYHSAEAVWGLIVLTPALHGAKLREVLLHEMCHLVCSRRRGVPGRVRGLPHGPVFQAKVRRLRALGETVAETSAPEALARESVLSEMRAMALDQPRMTWRTAQFELASLFMQELDGLPLERLAPWAKREWRRVVAEYWGRSDHHALRSQVQRPERR